MINPSPLKRHSISRIRRPGDAGYDAVVEVTTMQQGRARMIDEPNTAKGFRTREYRASAGPVPGSARRRTAKCVHRAGAMQAIGR